MLIEVINKKHYKLKEYPDIELTFDLQRKGSQDPRLKWMPELSNPYPITGKTTRTQSLAQFNAGLKGQIKERGTNPAGKVPGNAFFRLIQLTQIYREIAPQGRKMYLACTCKQPRKPVDCHCDIVAKAIDWLSQDKQWNIYCVPYLEILKELFDTSTEASNKDDDWDWTEYEEDKPEKFNLNRLVYWKECPSYISTFAHSRIRGVSPDGTMLLLGFVKDVVYAKDCIFSEDDIAEKFWAVYPPYESNQWDTDPVVVKRFGVAQPAGKELVPLR